MSKQDRLRSSIDDLWNQIKQGKHLSPNEIRSNPHFGEDAVQPLILADAAYIDGKGRENDTADIFHFLDTLIRPAYWGSGIPNDSLEQKY